MMIRIKNLRAQTLIGAYDDERQARRTVTLNLAIDYDHRNALITDALGETLDYAVIEQSIVEALPLQHFVLLESLAEYVAKIVMSYPLVREVTVEIDKPGALKHADSVSVIHTAAR